MSTAAKRNWSNVALIFLIFLIILTIWHTFQPSNLVDTPPENTDPAYILNTNTTNYIYPIDIINNSNDYNQLIDLNFTFTILNSPCNDSITPPLILIMVHSSPENFAKRKTIRETWGKNLNSDEKIKLLFVLGQVENSTLTKEIKEENRNFSDFIQGSFLDTYRNLTYKHVMLFKYAIYHCPEAKFILKTDDDVFVNIKSMLNFLNENFSRYGVRNLLFCTITKNAKVMRSFRSKWRVSFIEYPDKNYPTYCPGWFLLYSQNILFELYEKAQKSKYFWIDDIHLTGTLFKELHHVHTNSEEFMLTRNELNDIVNRKNITRNFLMGRPNLNEKQIRSLWSYVESKN